MGFNSAFKGLNTYMVFVYSLICRALFAMREM